MGRGMNKLTQTELQQLFDYRAGTLVRKVDRGRNGGSRWKSGEVAGHKLTGGYTGISIDGVGYKLHRLVWLWHHGVWPDGHIDHIDCDPTNNRIENLRVVSDAQNMQNIRKARVTNKLGVLGVIVQGGQFRARLTVDGKSVHVGYFKTSAEAHAAYVAAKRSLHSHSTI
jgi:hypothetical protein